MKKSILLFLVIISLYSCHTYHYFPTYQNVPTNQKKNEVSTTSFVNPENIGQSISYSVTDKVGAFATYNEFNGSNEAYICDVGLYAYKPLETILENTNVVISISGAYGFGKHYGSDMYHLKMNRVYLQPSFGYESKFVDFGASTRLSYLNYKVDYFDTKYGRENTSLKDVGIKPFYFIEPNLYIGLGYKWIKLNYHYMVLNKLNSAKIEYYRDNVSFFSLSIKYDIDKIFKKKE